MESRDILVQIRQLQEDEGALLDRLRAIRFKKVELFKLLNVRYSHNLGAVVSGNWFCAIPVEVWISDICTRLSVGDNVSLLFSSYKLYEILVRVPVFWKMLYINYFHITPIFTGDWRDFFIRRMKKWYPSSKAMLNKDNCNNIVPSREKQKKGHIFRITHEGSYTIFFHSSTTGNWTLNTPSILQPIPLDIQPKVIYYEITIEDPLGTSTRECLGIGLLQKGAGLGNIMPGWVRGSYAMHSDDGNIHYNNDASIYNCKSIAYGPPFHAVGKTVGCGFNYTTREIFFTHEGQFLGVAFTLPQEVPLGALSPCVGTNTIPSKISINLGSCPFHFNIDAYICGRDIEGSTLPELIPIRHKDWEQPHITQFPLL